VAETKPAPTHAPSHEPAGGAPKKKGLDRKWLYIAGGVLVVAVLVLFVTKKGEATEEKAGVPLGPGGSGGGEGGGGTGTPAATTASTVQSPLETAEIERTKAETALVDKATNEPPPAAAAAAAAGASPAEQERLKQVEGQYAKAEAEKAKILAAQKKPSTREKAGAKTKAKPAAKAPAKKAAAKPAAKAAPAKKAAAKAPSRKK
jgi:hypothetical protein